MNRLVILLSIVSNICLLNAAGKSEGTKKRIVADKALAIIYHNEGKIIISQSDLNPDLFSDQPLPLQEVILRHLIVLDSKKYKIVVSAAEIDRHIARIQESLKKTREELTAFFTERGFTYEQAEGEIERSLLVENTISERVRSKALVPESAIRKHYNENPVIDYSVKQAFVPFGLGSKAITRATIDREIESGTIGSGLEWSDALVLKEKDIAQEKAFIKELKPGMVTRVQETEEGISLLQLVSKTQVPYEVLKPQITSELGMKNYKKAQQEYFDGLFAQAHIRYLDKSVH